MKHRPLCSRKGLRLSNYFRSNRTQSFSKRRVSVRSRTSRAESVSSVKSSKAEKQEKSQAGIVAVKKLKGK